MNRSLFPGGLVYLGANRKQQKLISFVKIEKIPAWCISFPYYLKTIPSMRENPQQTNFRLGNPFAIERLLRKRPEQIFKPFPRKGSSYCFYFSLSLVLKRLHRNGFQRVEGLMENLLHISRKLIRIIIYKV